MIKELSYLRERVRVDLEIDGRLSESYRMSVMSTLDAAIKDIAKGEMRVKP